MQNESVQQNHLPGRKPAAAAVGKQALALKPPAQFFSNTESGEFPETAAPAGAVQCRALPVAQLVNAYRAEGSLENPKIQTNRSGAYTGLSADAKQEGISMSFKSDDHFNYFSAGSKLLITMDFNDTVYENIEQIMANKKGSLENPYKKLSDPSPCSDPVMKKQLKGKISNKQVLTFSKDWADTLETAISNTREEIVGDDAIKDSDTVLADVDDTAADADRYAEMTKKDAEEAGFTWISYAKAKKWGIPTG